MGIADVTVAELMVEALTNMVAEEPCWSNTMLVEPTSR